MNGRWVGWFAASALCSLAACVVSKDSLGDGGMADDANDDGDAENADDASDDPGGSSTGGDGNTGPGEPGPTEGGSDDTGPIGSSTGDDGPVDPACAAIDHDTCFTAVQAACYGNGNWDADEDCVAAVLDCYPVGTDALATSDVIDFCSAEFAEECIGGNGPGCGQTFCECTSGVYPFDWTNCWHLLLLACSPGVDSDCATVLGSCYPGATVPQYEACRDQINGEGEGECNCPMCGQHVACEASLDECLGG